mmetsp:Transcript_167291/g.531879  ORF Transcript_167291/g.531879 Transcript_167291/m.531879 type:complete len:203 (-) Transcript_167291:269-877(-)
MRGAASCRPVGHHRHGSFIACGLRGCRPKLAKTEIPWDEAQLDGRKGAAEPGKRRFSVDFARGLERSDEGGAKGLFRLQRQGQEGLQLDLGKRKCWTDRRGARNHSRHQGGGARREKKGHVQHCDQGLRPKRGAGSGRDVLQGHDRPRHQAEYQDLRQIDARLAVGRATRRMQEVVRRDDREEVGAKRRQFQLHASGLLQAG